MAVARLDPLLDDVAIEHPHEVKPGEVPIEPEHEVRHVSYNLTAPTAPTFLPLLHSYRPHRSCGSRQPAHPARVCVSLAPPLQVHAEATDHETHVKVVPSEAPIEPHDSEKGAEPHHPTPVHVPPTQPESEALLHALAAIETSHEMRDAITGLQVPHTPALTTRLH